MFASPKCWDKRTSTVEEYEAQGKFPSKAIYC